VEELLAKPAGAWVVTRRIGSGPGSRIEPGRTEWDRGEIHLAGAAGTGNPRLRLRVEPRRDRLEEQVKDKRPHPGGVAASGFVATMRFESDLSHLPTIRCDGDDPVRRDSIGGA